jgi:hypothetical protein
MEMSGQLHDQTALTVGKGPLVPTEKAGWVSPKAGLHAVKRKILLLLAIKPWLSCLFLLLYWPTQFVQNLEHEQNQIKET